ncbi:replication/maintenance protein RepL [Clostridium butyricum]|uniref:replication/maintenance protein RepL n=1 Tax=Clostridium butyricum TaxID=1492 RepID=UPI002AAF24D5|nr:helix-turn-helix domain-containing protein [Clostridium butyricum]
MIQKKLLLYLQYISLLNLKTKEYKVFLYIINQLNTQNYTIINQKQLSEELGLSKSEISKAIKKLINEEIFVLNPSSIYKSKKKEIKLNDYSVDELEDMIYDLLEENTLFNYYED